MHFRYFSAAILFLTFLTFAQAQDTPLVPLPTGPRLKTLGAEHHLLIGGATDLNHNDPREEAIVKNEYSILSPENCLKTRVLQPKEGTFNFAESDKLVKFCMDNHIIAKGHTLIGRNLYLPKWMQDPNLTADQLKQILVDHITTVMNRYKKGSSYGEIKYWDVMNEVITGHSVFEKLGQNSDGDFIYWELAFQTARQVDPDCVLIWNEDGVDCNPRKAEKWYQAVKRLKAKGIPIDGVGFQCHIGYDKRPLPDYTALANDFQRFADLGCSIIVSEMDVPDNLDQINIYKNILGLCVAQPKCIIWDTWNVVDKYSWRAKDEKGLLLFDDNYAAKPTYYAVQSALEGTTTGPSSATSATDTPRN